MELAAIVRDRLDGAADDRLFRFRGDWYHRGWVSDHARRLDAAIDAQGLPADAPIGFAPHNRPEFAAALLALMARGRNIVMIYAYQSAEAMAGRLDDLALPLVIAARDQWTAPMLAVADRHRSGAIALSADAIETLRRADPAADHASPPVEPGIALLTSGTTGPPKHFPMSYARLHSRMVLGTAVDPAKSAPLLHFFPFGNISGVYTLLPAIASGQPIVMLEKFDVALWLEFVKAWRPASVNLAPAAFRMILDAAVDPADLASLKHVYTGAATLDPGLRREFEQRYATTILQSYGATEFGGIVAATLPDHRAEFGEAKADAAGRACPGVSLRVVDPESGAELPPGREGRLEVLAPAMAAAWIATTDLAMIDADGFLFHRGRLDGAIVRGGFKIMPEQVAEALSRHPAVAGAAVVGIADARLGEVPAALVQLRDGAAPPADAEFERHLRALLPAPALPKAYRIVAALPRTASLKVDMAAVRALFEEEAA